MSRVSKSRKTVQYHIEQKFSPDNKIYEEQILNVFQMYYTDKINEILTINNKK